MRKFKFLFGLLVMLCTLSWLSVTAAAVETVDLPITVEEDYSMAQELLTIINNRRAELGFEPYQMDSRVQDIAMQRATDLIISMSHNRPDGSGTIAVSYLNIIGEDIANGYGSAQSMFNGWRTSPLHAAVMFDKYTKYCGIGCVMYEGSRFWVLNTSDTPMGSVTSESGVKNSQRTITADASRIKFGIHDWTVSGYGTYRGLGKTATMHYGKPASVRVVIKNFFPEDDVGIGYVCDPSLVTYSGGTPGIAEVSPEGVVTPLKTGSATLTVALKAAPSTAGTVPFEVATNTRLANPTAEQVSASSYPYTGKPVEPKYTVTDCFGNILKEGVDYYIEYKDNVEPGTAYANIWMQGNYLDPEIASYQFITRDFNIMEPDVKETEQDAGGLEVKLAKAAYVYNGKARKPAVSVYADGEKLHPGKYKVSYKNNRSIGTAEVTVSGTGKYKGLMAAARFEILPKKPSLSGVKTKGMKARLAWKKTQQAGGYQVQCSPDSRFAKNVKSKKVGKTTLMVSGLKKGKVYYIRVRAYKKVKGKVYYSAWSKVKKIRIK